MNDVTQILPAMERGDSNAADKLLPLVYDELRKLAAAKLALENPGITLQATALVHEAYLRLVATPDGQPGLPPPHWDGRGHFFAAAGEAMRRILVEHARHKKSVSQKGAAEIGVEPISDSTQQQLRSQWNAIEPLTVLFRTISRQTPDRSAGLRGHAGP